MTCLKEGCSRPAATRGYCKSHYVHALRTGVIAPLPKPTTMERFLAKVEPQPNGCWHWTGTVAGRYGQFAIRRNGVVAHRWLYEQIAGQVDTALQLDHLCRNTICVNPDHLEPVTGRENIMRSDAVSAINARKTHCIHGHPFDDANTLHRSGAPEGVVWRACRACAAAKERRKRARRKAAA